MNKRQDDKVDLTNYKGIYFGDDTSKFTDDKTGAHFDYQDMCKRLMKAGDERKRKDEAWESKYGPAPQKLELSPQRLQTEGPAGPKSGERKFEGNRSLPKITKI